MTAHVEIVRRRNADDRPRARVTRSGAPRRPRVSEERSPRSVAFDTRVTDSGAGAIQGLRTQARHTQYLGSESGYGLVTNRCDAGVQSPIFQKSGFHRIGEHFSSKDRTESIGPLSVKTRAAEPRVKRQNSRPFASLCENFRAAPAAWRRRIADSKMAMSEFPPRAKTPVATARETAGPGERAEPRVNPRADSSEVRDSREEALPSAGVFPFRRPEKSLPRTFCIPFRKSISPAARRVPPTPPRGC